jgi:hypothetical protein
LANENQSDPGALFRDLVTQWERNFNAFANQIMGTESFSRAMQGAQKAQLTLQQTVSDVMQRHLTTMNMPTREDVIRISEKVHEIDRRLARIEMLLEANAAAAQQTSGANPSGPRRTKQPPEDYAQSRGAEGSSHAQSRDAEGSSHAQSRGAEGSSHAQSRGAEGSSHAQSRGAEGSSSGGSGHG